MAVKVEQGDKVVRLCIELSDKDEQDVYLWEHIKGFLEDELIEAELFWGNDEEDRTHVPEKEFHQRSIIMS